MPSRLSVSGSLRARAVDRRYFRRERERGGHGHDGELGKAAGAPAEPDHPGRGAVGHLTGRAPVTPAAGQHREHRRAVPGTPARQAGPDAHDLAAELVPHDRALGMAARAVRSEPQRPQAVTRSSSSPGPGDGSGTATTSYRPSAPTTAARTTPPTGSDLAAAAAGRAAAAMSGGAHRRWRPALAVRLDRLDDRLPVFEGLVADLDVERGRVAELQHLHALRPGGVGVGGLGEDEEAVAGVQDPAAHVGLTGDDVVQAVGRVAVAGQPVARREAHVHEAEAVRSLALE